MRSVMAAFNEDLAYDFFLLFAGSAATSLHSCGWVPKWRYNDSYSNVCKTESKPIKAAVDTVVMNIHMLIMHR